MNRRHLTLIIVLLVVNIVVRIIYVTGFLSAYKYYWDDAPRYHCAAVNIIENGTFGLEKDQTWQRPYSDDPVYPLIIAGLIAILGKSFLPIRIFQSVLLALSGYLFYRILSLFIKREWLRILGTGVFLFYPFYIFLGGMVTPECIYTGLLVLFVYLCITYMESKNTTIYLSAAILAGILIHVKTTFLPVLGILLLLPFIMNRRRLYKNMLWALVCILIVLTISLPWGIRNYKTYGKITLPRNRFKTGKDEPVRYINNMMKRGMRWIPDNAAAYFSPFLTRVTTKDEREETWFVENPLQIISFICVTPLLLGAIVLPFLRRDKTILMLYIIFLLYSLPYIVLFGQTRYRLPIDFILIAFLVITIEQVLIRVRRLSQGQQGENAGLCTAREAGET